MLDPINDLIADPGFRTGVLFGLVAAAVVAVGALVARPVRPWAGAAFGVAAVLALADRIGSADRVPVTAELVVGLALLAAGGVLAGRGHPAVRLAAAVPGAVVVARSTDLHEPGWAMPTIVVASVVGGVLAAECDRALGRRGLTPVLLAATVLGVYATTPDTEHARVLAGVALPVALLGWPWPLASLGTAGALVSAALVSWTAVVDGLARPGAVVGAIACLGVLAIEPTVRWALHGRPLAGRSGSPPLAETTVARRSGSPPLAETVFAGVVHLGVVGVCSRVAGLRTSATQALAISAGAFVVAAAALIAAQLRRAR